MLRCALLIVLILLGGSLPYRVDANLIFSEIMYDLEGSDSKREWVEVFNTGPGAQSLEGWRLFEGGVNHTLNLISGSETLGVGEYAVIADSANDFLVDWSEFSGTLFDSAFSLKNTGEELILRDSELNDIDSVTYTSDDGASGDGQSLQYNGSTWAPATPTPGSGVLTSSGSSQEEESGEESSGASSGGSVSKAPVEPQIFAYAGEDRVVTVGADVLFKGRAVGFSGEPLINARFVWSFGDGSRREGESVLHHYQHPGDYVVVLDVTSNKYAASDRLYISAEDADIALGYVGSDAIEIINNASREINMSWWMIRDGDNVFTLPEHTIVRADSAVMLPSSVTGISPTDSSSVILLYPNGIVVPTAVEMTQHIQEQTREISGIGGSIVGKPVYPQYIEEGEDSISHVTNAVASSETEPFSSQQGAVVSEAVEVSEKQTGLFIVGLVGVIMLGAVSVLFLRRESREEITIID